MGQPPRLFHVSEDPGLERFEPRGADDPRVWCIAEARVQNYLLPRDCPRVTFYANSETQRADRERFLGASHSVVAIEGAWLKRCLATPLHLYEFDPVPFESHDDVAGYWIARQTVRPIDRVAVANPVAALLERGVELRILPSLWPLREAVAGSTLAFSVIRMRNAAPAPSGFVSRFPVTPPRAG